MSLIYRRKRKDDSAWRVIDISKLPPLKPRAPEGKPVDQMTNAELKAEMKRRLPCCGPEKAGFVADLRVAQDAKTAPSTLA